MRAREKPGAAGAKFHDGGLARPRNRATQLQWELCADSHPAVASIVESLVASYIAEVSTRIEWAWHEGLAARIFHFTAGVFRPGWQNVWPPLAPLFAKPSSITTGVMHQDGRETVTMPWRTF